MKEQDTGVMEKQYLTLENLPPEQKPSEKNPKNRLPKFKLPNPKNILAGFKSVLKKLKSPKILIILVIIFALVIVSLAFLKLYSKSSYVPSVDIVDLLPASPTPDLDPELKNLKNQVDQYQVDLEQLSADRQDVAFPQVDLKISF